MMAKNRKVRPIRYSNPVVASDTLLGQIKMLDEQIQRLQSRRDKARTENQREFNIWICRLYATRRKLIARRRIAVEAISSRIEEQFVNGQLGYGV